MDTDTLAEIINTSSDRLASRRGFPHREEDVRRSGDVEVLIEDLLDVTLRDFSKLAEGLARKKISTSDEAASLLVVFNYKTKTTNGFFLDFLRDGSVNLEFGVTTLYHIPCKT